MGFNVFVLSCAPGGPIYYLFLQRKNPNGLARNRITDPKKATPHTHQMAIAIDTLMEIVTGIKLENDPIYLRKRKMHTPDGIDDLIGFNPNCIIK